MPEPAGYFVWRRSNGRITHSKYHAQGESVMPETRAYYEAITLAKFPLSADEWENDSLDQLAARYPLPERFRERT